MEYRVLGPVEVDDSGREVPLDGGKPRTVLAALLLAENRLVPNTEISGFLWGGHPPATMNAQIYSYISRLRKSLGPKGSITRRSPGYQLRIGSARFDLTEFEGHLRGGRAALAAGNYVEAAARLRTAVGLWRGPALANVSDHLVEVERPRLEEARLSAMESLFDSDLALGRHGLVLPELIRLVQQHPLRERLRAQLMTTLYRCDRQADALALYDDGRRLLAEQLGVDPGALLRAVHQAILTSDPRLHVPRGRQRILTTVAATTVARSGNGAARTPVADARRAG